jgi:putative ABC transport system permease protein
MDLVRKNPSARRRASPFAVAALLQLGLASGLALPVFGLVEAGLFRELAYANPRALAGLESHGGISDWSDEARTPVQLQGERIDTLLKTLAVLSAFVLAIGCVNLASLLLSKGAQRRHGLAVRSAVGARWTQLAGGLLTEIARLACFGIAIGFLLGLAGVAALRTTWPQTVPSWLSAGLPPLSMTTAIGIPLAALVFFGLLPAIVFWRSDLRSALTAGHNVTAGILEGLARRAFLFLSIAATALLLANTLLIVRAADGGVAYEAGTAGAETLAMTIELPEAGLSGTNERVTLYGELLEHLQSVPGAAVSSIASAGTWVGMGVFDVNMVDCGACSIGGVYVPVFPETVRHHVVGPSYFDTVGVALLSGREFTEADRIGAPLVAIVNQAFAVRSFERGQPIGRGVQLEMGWGEWYTVVGVVPNTDPPGIGVGEEPVPAMYLSALQHPPRVAQLAVRTTDGDPLALAPLEAGAAAAAGPEIRVSAPSTLAEQRRQFIEPLRWFSWLLAAVAMAAIAFSTIALYHVMAFAVRSRTREIGVRMAIGAHPRQVTTMVLWDALRLTITASLIGLMFAIGVARILQQAFMGVRPLDAAVYLTVAGLLAVVALIAAFVPARRAARVDPAVAFRAE